MSRLWSLGQRRLNADYRAIEADRRTSTIGWAGLLAGVYSQSILGTWSEGLTMAGFEFVALSLITTDRRLPLRLSLDRLGACTFVGVTFLIGACVAWTGGPHSPYILMMMLPVGMIAARFRLRTVIAALALTLATTVLVTTVVYTHTGTAEPPSLILKLVLMGLVVFVVWGLRAGKVLHSDESIIDPVTGLLERNGLALRFLEISHEARLTGREVSLIVFNVRRIETNTPHRSRYPDDALLRKVARVVREAMRPYELIYRLWGGMFAIVLPDTEPQTAVYVAQRLRDMVEDIRLEDGSAGISFGVGAARGRRVDLDRLLREAGTALDVDEHGRP